MNIVTKQKWVTCFIIRSLIYKEEEKYDTSGFLVELGGALSLFLGSSLVSVFEYLEWVVRFIVAIFFNVY